MSSKASPESPIDFSRDVRPILSEHCWVCHGPDKEANAKTGGMRLDSFAAATKGEPGFVPIVPGKPDESRVIARINADQPEMVMPPPNSTVKPLSAAQKSILRKWIEAGAEYRVHWAFVPPKAPALPAAQTNGWAKNEIDRFVLAKLEESGLKPEPEAPKRTLIRRVSLTLTGLPPSLAEINQYLNDKSRNAYEKMVDRYLNSRFYGEHQARYWLDAVRYGDTHGLHLDNERSIYPYRDFVVRAMEQDLPFNTFTLWQLAGDLLPNPSLDMKLATAYVRMNVTTNEGGAIEEEFLVKNTFDRVDTMGTVYLGMTIGCAKCHDHKFDPISQEDYYGLFAFLNSTKDAPLDGNLLVPEPSVLAPSIVQQRQLAALARQLDKLESKVKLSQAQGWIRTNRVAQPVIASWEVSPAYPAKNFEEAYNTAFAPEQSGSSGIDWKPIKLQIDKPIAVAKRENAAGYVRAEMILDSPAKVTFRLGSDDAIKFWADGKLVHANKVLRGINEGNDQVAVDFSAGKHALLFKIVNSGGPEAILVGFGSPREVRIDSLYRQIGQEKNPTPFIQAFLELGPETTESLAYRKAAAERSDIMKAVPFCLIAEELPKPRPAFLLRRGEYNLPTTPVSRAIPSALGSLPQEAPKNRLGLAKWLTDASNPLVSRVFVNRIWQQHFGTGIVKTAEDFGNQGEWPSHPELLDFLAVQFVKNGWSLKKLHRLILTSASFRQGSGASAPKRQIDPENRLVSRGPRFRLDAEVLRDQVLYVSQLLNVERGGRGFKPYQPSGIWETVAFADSTTAKYVQDKGKDIYKRSLYLFWKRTSPHPMMLTFDAPMRESCSVRRSRTNTPLQALATMNEPMFVESARALAEKLLGANASNEERVKKLFEVCLGRQPQEAEQNLLLKSLYKYEKSFLAPNASFAILETGDSRPNPILPRPTLAAWTLVVSTIFNTDEFLTQH